MQLKELEALGAYVVAGAVEAQGGVTLGQVLASGEVLLRPDAQEWIDARKPVEPAAPEAPAAKVSAKRVAKAATAAPAEDPPGGDLAGLLNGGD